MMLLLRLAEGDVMLEATVLEGVGFSVVAWEGAVMLQWSPMLLRPGKWKAAEEPRGSKGLCDACAAGDPRHQAGLK